jgi:methionyl aminopeptidase
MVSIKTKKEIEILREGGRILAFVLHEVAKNARLGVMTMELDRLAEELIKKKGGSPSFKNYKTSDDKIPYPASLCVSINDEVVHGIPSERKLKDGDIVSLDLGLEYKGFYTDIAVTVPIGKVSKNAKKIIDATKKSLDKGIKIIKENVFTGDIGYAIQSYAESKGFNVVRRLVGHGVGYDVHEDPQVPNFGKPKTGIQLKTGMVLALEPMLTDGDFDIIIDKDNWTWKTKDGSLSAHFEHTIVVTKSGAEILTKM